MDEWTRLALEAQAGTESALRAFVGATHADVWRLCAHLGDVDAADDLTQETFLRVFRSLPAYRGDSPVRSWLFSIVRRVAADDIARRQRVRRLPDLDPAPSRDHATGVVLEMLLAQLDHDRRVAFVLTQLWGFSYEATAAICDCPVGTIRSRISRARADLVTLLGTTDVSSESA